MSALMREHPLDELNTALEDAFGMVCMITGDGFAHFDEFNEKTKHGYLNSIYGRLDAAREAFEKVLDERAASKAVQP
jgi:hypothetical protein